MRIPAFLAVFAIAAISQLAHANEDPLTPAKAGKIWCHEPDSEIKPAAPSAVSNGMQQAAFGKKMN